MRIQSTRPFYNFFCYCEFYMAAEKRIIFYHFLNSSGEYRTPSLLPPVHRMRSQNVDVDADHLCSPRLLRINKERRSRV